jgi:zinc/manganese transport system ATP-binding protein
MDQVVYIAGGRVACGPTDEVIRSEVLSRLYGQHVDVLHVHDRILVVAGSGDPDDPGADVTVTHAHGVRSTP